MQNNVRVFYRKFKKPMWKTWKRWGECSEQEKKETNLRTLFADEIVLDFEQKDLYKRYLNELENYNFEVWFSGSRGDHIHLRFTELKGFEKSIRNRIRKLFIQQFPEADESKASENTLISIENKPHHKTNKTKKLVFENKINKENILPKNIVKNATIIKNDYYTIKINPSWIKKDPILQFVLNNKIPYNEGTLNRHGVLFKNLAIGLVQANLTEGEIKSYAQRIVSNCPGQTLAAFMGWVSAARRGQYKQYNKKEMLSWFKKHRRILEKCQK